MSETIPKPRIGEPIAAGDGNNLARAYTGQLAQSSDRVLRMRGGGDLAIYEQVKSDAQVKSCFEQRRNAVTAREWQVDAGGDRRIDIKAADHLRAQLERVGWDNVTDKMLWGVFYGYSVAELLWDVRDGLYGWRGIKVRQRRKFRFTDAGELRLFSMVDPIHGIPAPAPYFWHFATGADNDDEPYGLGLAHWCYWPALFKRQDIMFWLIFLEKFGMPTVHGKFPVGADATEKARLLAACQAVRGDSAIITPEGMALDLLEAARGGTADYKVLHDTMNETIAKAIIGQTASSQGTPGKLGNEDLQGDVRLDIVKADADLVCESFNLGPVAWMTQFNFPGAAPPRVFRVVQEPEDANTLAERDTKVRAMGFVPSLDYVHEQYGDHWEPGPPPQGYSPGAIAPGPGGGGPGQQPGAFAEPAPLALSDQVAGRLEAEAEPLLAGWIERLQMAVEESADLPAFRARLDTDFADLPTEQLTALIAQALLTAELGGRASVQDEFEQSQQEQ